MKKVLLFLFLLPFCAFAQEDSKYMEGAVPEVDGKVIFQTELTSTVLSPEMVYETINKWMHERFSREGCRVVYENSEEGQVAAVGEEYIEFSRTVLALDRSRMQYQVTAECKGQSCLLQFKNIRYEYDVTYQREPEKYTAEEWITDKYAIHKGKLNRISGKFRIKTVDFANQLFADAKKALGLNTLEIEEEKAQATIIETPAKSTDLPGYKSYAVSELPEIMKSLLSSSPFSVESNGQTIISTGKAEWKGMGTMFGKNIVSFATPANNSDISNLKDNDIYKLSFFKTANDNEAWIIIECRKSGSSTENEQNVTIGEITNIWVK